MPKLRIALIVALVLMAAGPAHAARRIALVIGNDAYVELPVLGKAVADARRFAAVLEAKGFDQVMLRTDQSRQSMDEAIAGFLDAIEPGDTAVFVYSGHGWSDGSQNYLVGTDAPRSAAEGLLTRLSIPLQNGANGIIDEMGRRGAALKVAIVDACRDNPFTSPVAGRGVGLGRGLSRIEPPRGTFVVFSAGAGQTALDRLSDNDPDPNSVFSRTFLPLIEQDLPLLDAVKAAQQQVYDLALSVAHEQEPAYYDQVRGSACLSAECIGAGLVAAPAPAPEIDREALFWNSIANSERAADYEAYLSQFPDGTFAVLAQNRLAALQPPTEPSPPPDAPAPTRAVHAAGSLVMPASFLVDFDRGLVDPDGADLKYEEVGSREHYLEPRNAALLGVGNPGCVGAGYAAAKLRVEEVQPGSVVCLYTSEGHFAELTLHELNAALNLPVDFTTYVERP